MQQHNRVAMAFFVAAGQFAAAALLAYFLRNLFRAALWAACHEECPRRDSETARAAALPALWFAVCVWFLGGAKPLRAAK
jgi:hypothetical protein